MSPCGQPEVSVRFLIQPGIGYKPSKREKPREAFLGLTSTISNNALKERGWKATVSIPSGGVDCMATGNVRETRLRRARYKDLNSASVTRSDPILTGLFPMCTCDLMRGPRDLSDPMPNQMYMMGQMYQMP